VHALVASEDGARVIRDSVSGGSENAEELGIDVARRLLAEGARDILAGIAG
jgi:hydroxymethylbilane synthase